MSHQNQSQEITGIKQTLGRFADALNAAEASLLPSFFTEDGKFMPEGVRTIGNPALLNKSGNKNLATVSFHIQFNILYVSVEGKFAFLTAEAITSQIQIDHEERVSKASRDFFVFKKIDETWKIHRYIFNNVKMVA